MEANAVEFRLADGTCLVVEEADLRRIYEELWDLSGVTGAISTAVLLIDEARKYNRYRRPVELNVAESAALREAVANLASLQRSGVLPEHWPGQEL